MAKTGNQKAKLLVLERLLLSSTDENHPLSIQDMISMLEEKGIAAERKSLYDDLRILSEMGLDIVHIPGKSGGYYIGSRAFELPELKLLVDAVQSSKFITHKKSNELIGKIETLCSSHEARELQRQVFVSGRVKTMNESIYYNVDKIHSAILQNVSITFQYFEWNLKKERVLRRNGALYRVSPWALTWDDENYYLIAYDEGSSSIRHYRVDKMIRITATDQPRKGENQFSSFDTAAYARKIFGMFGGDEITVQLSVPNRYIGVLIDRFGKDIPVIPEDDDRFTTVLHVAESPQFYSWVFSLSGVRILSPERVQKSFRSMCEAILQ